jgi:Fe-S-cluster containining protein
MHKPWTCQRSGDCCREPDVVVMTPAERAEIERAAPDVALSFTATPDGFVALKARPCPLLAGNDCSVYAVRPYNCRRYACGRDDVAVRRDPNPVPARFYTDRAFRRQMMLMQRKAQTWGRAHGWQ